VLWKFPRSSMTIPIELHQKILRSGHPICDDVGEIVGVRCAPAATDPGAERKASRSCDSGCKNQSALTRPPG
jgi:hypothetical protein